MSQRVIEELGEGEHVQLGGPGQASFRRRHSGRAVVDKKGRFQNRVSNPSSRLWIVATASLHSSQSDVLPTPPPLYQPLTAPHRFSKETRGTLLSHPACLQQLWTNLQPAVPLPRPQLGDPPCPSAQRRRFASFFRSQLRQKPPILPASVRLCLHSTL